ncbi:uncharacterized protein H6S33_008265 [Morchella sextelata]|uniref:uncharacterized protein n=1 Tax=Morchella sextelata TaxID=1174677 RepID=UPI001D0373C6|nr:uncharacterized protein H6S33_008265 [Morchella sextelata]KAH0603261.1 hypothetical protein H6S33_008265 [Morchella sextelata]
MSTAPVRSSIANLATNDPATEEVRERPTTTDEECISFFEDYLETERKSLKTFYKDEDIPKLGAKAKTMFGALIELGCKKETAQQLTLLTLYDIVMLIDDSRSMKTEQKGERIETLHRTIDEITRIYDYANEKGIKSVKFLNEKKGIANVKNKNWKRNFKNKVYNGVTKIGTSLSQKVLDKFVWGETMTKPLLVMIITDGDVEGEREGLLADVIASCVERLAKDEQRGKQAVSFHFSRVGNDKEAQKLLEKMDDSEAFGDHVDCLPANDALEKLRDPTGQHKWTLPKLLLGAISIYWDQEGDDVVVDVTANTEAAPKEDDSDEDADAGSSDDDDDDADDE